MIPQTTDAIATDLVKLSFRDEIFTTEGAFHPRDCFETLEFQDNWRRFTKFGLELEKPLPKLVPVSQNLVFRSIKAHALLGEAWENTDLFKAAEPIISAGGSLWGCSTTQQFLDRLNTKISALMRSIEQFGYLSQQAIIERLSVKGNKNNSALHAFNAGRYYDPLDPFNEIKVGIGPAGQIILLEGQHRLSAAILLQVPSFPALVAFRHSRWSQLKRELTEKHDVSGPWRLDHPDLARLSFSDKDILCAASRVARIMNNESSLRLSSAVSPQEITLSRVPRPKFLTLKAYLAAVEQVGGGHWENAQRRWTYHSAAALIAQIVNPSSPRSVLEMGTMGVNVVEGSDTIDFEKAWNFQGKAPTYVHDGRQIPWPVADDSYELFIALRVFHHLAPVQKQAFLEARRIASNIVIVAPESYDKVPGSAGIPLVKLIEWNGGVPPTAIMELGAEFGHLYFWNAAALGKT